MSVGKLVICVNANDFAILEKGFDFTHLIPEKKKMFTQICKCFRNHETHLPFPPTFFLFCRGGLDAIVVQVIGCKPLLYGYISGFNCSL